MTRDFIVCLHCTCGASLELATDEEDAALRVGLWWEESHRGEGHARTSKEHAEHIRAMQEGDLSEWDEG